MKRTFVVEVDDTLSGPFEVFDGPYLLEGIQAGIRKTYGAMTVKNVRVVDGDIPTLNVPLGKTTFFHSKEDR